MFVTESSKDGRLDGEAPSRADDVLLSDGSPADVARADETAVEMPGLSEACRRFPMPETDYAAHALRELSWGEHFIVTRMLPSKGGTDLYLYNLRSAAVFLLDREAASASVRSEGAIKLIDIDGFVEWLRSAVGDTVLADVIEKEIAEDASYSDKLQTIQLLLGLRMIQYRSLEEEKTDDPEPEDV